MFNLNLMMHNIYTVTKSGFQLRQIP